MVGPRGLVVCETSAASSSKHFMVSPDSPVSSGSN
jgi:hypothetical protein